MFYYMLESLTPPLRYGPPSRGVTSRDVELAADALLRAGERPTIERIREKIGRGSPNTINPLLDAWWKRLASRLDAGPAALHRLPESVAHVAEALWMQALDEGRRRAEQELLRDARGAAQKKSDLEVRSHVLALREGELTARLHERERAIADLNLRLREMTVMLRKQQATDETQRQRIAALESELSTRRRPQAIRKPKPLRPTAPKVKVKMRKRKASKPPTPRSRAKAKIFRR
jgi:Plasmid replication region DNA-binding N-term